MTFRAAFYKGTRPGLSGIYNRGVRAWTRSSYSHAELVFPSGWSASSSYMDGGVRLKMIDFDPALWDFVDVPPAFEKAAFQWFLDHRGAKYDLLGDLHFVIAPVEGGKDKWFCSESIAAALGLPEPWRYDPATLFSVLTFINQPASAGFSI
jgi:hypothetical protein